MPVKVSEIIRLIEADGWYLVVTRGSHRQYKHPDKPRAGHHSGQAERDFASSYRAEHPETSTVGTEAAVTKYVAIIERDEEGGYSAWVPDLPGVVAAASTYDECLDLIRQAVELHLEGLREDGEPIPAPSAIGAETVIAAA